MEHTDVVIIGAGGAGMMAALTLAKAGRSCVVLEKGKHLSVSNAARAGGPSLADTLLQEEENCIVSAEMLFRHMYGFSRGTVDGGLLYRCIRNGRKVETLLRESGIQLRLTEDLYSVGFRARHFFETPAPQRWELLAKKLEEYGGRVVLNACAGELLTENGRICGVLAVDGQSGEQTAYYGKAVIIASGGYLGNEEMLKQHFGDITVGPLGSRLSDGAGIAMALKAGGMEDRSWGICAGEFGGYHSRMKGRFPGNMRWAMTGGLLVDREGRRFMDEQLLADQPLSVGGEATLRAGSYYAVLDEAFYQAYVLPGRYTTFMAVRRNGRLESPPLTGDPGPSRRIWKGISVRAGLSAVAALRKRRRIFPFLFWKKRLRATMPCARPGRIRNLGKTAGC